MTTKLEILARWNTDEGKPYKGALIDFDAYQRDPNNPGCMCAQGQVLCAIGGMNPKNLRYVTQRDADKRVASLLDISTAHAIVLRIVNDTMDGAPAILLTEPEKVLGPNAQAMLAFWRHLDRMSRSDWAKIDATNNAARYAVHADARCAAYYAVSEAVSHAARKYFSDAAYYAARYAVSHAARKYASDAARNATWEIMGEHLMRERNQPFFFLTMFGFADPEAVLAADKEA